MQTVTFFVSLFHVYPRCKDAKQCLIKTDFKIFINVKPLFGNIICQILPEFHGFTGCDTISSPFRVSKIMSFKKCSV